MRRKKRRARPVCREPSEPEQQRFDSTTSHTRKDNNKRGQDNVVVFQIPAFFLLVVGFQVNQWHKEEDFNHNIKELYKIIIQKEVPVVQSKDVDCIFILIVYPLCILFSTGH